MSKLLQYSSLRKQEGFTLVEMLVVVLLFSVVLIIASTVLMSISKVNNKSQLINSLRNDGVRVIEEIDSNIRESDEVYNPGNDHHILVYRVNSTLNAYQIVVTGNSDNNYIKRLEDCDTALTSCASETVITPDDPKIGLNIGEESTIYTVTGFESKYLIYFQQSKTAPDLPDYQAEIPFSGLITLRNY